MNKVSRAASGFEYGETWKLQRFRGLAGSCVGAGAACLVACVILAVLVPQFPYWFILPGISAFLLLSLFCLWLAHRGQLFWGVGLLLLNLMATLFVGAYFANGMSGPFAIALILLPVLAALVAGPKAARYTALSIASLYLGLIVLEWYELLQPKEMSSSTAPVVYGITFIFTLATVSFAVRRFVDLSQRALHIARQRNQQLTEVSEQAQQATLAEREARERQERAGRQRQQKVQEYLAFLKQVAAGDYSARLNHEELHLDEQEAPELYALGQYLNSTVEILVKALQNMQIIQSRYLGQAWEQFTRSGAVHTGFRYRNTGIETADEAWPASIAQAVVDGELIVTEHNLALPIRLHAEVIGVIDACRKEKTGWSDEELVLAAAVTDQLAQTIEGLRLLDESQRRAAQERLVSEVTARMRETLDMDTVLKTAAREMGEALQLHDVTIRLEAGIDGSG